MATTGVPKTALEFSFTHSFFFPPSPLSPPSYIIEQDVCFLTLCDRGFNKKLAYSFLEDLSQEFYGQYGHKISTATRPYSFIEFGKPSSTAEPRNSKL